MRLREPRWARYINAAVGEGRAEPAARRWQWLRRKGTDLRRRLEQAHTAQVEAQEYRRPDIRLLPAVVAAWGTAALATTLPGRGIPLAALAFLPTGLGILGVLFPRRGTGRKRTRNVRSRGQPRNASWSPAAAYRSKRGRPGRQQRHGMPLGRGPSLRCGRTGQGGPRGASRRLQGRPPAARPTGGTLLLAALCGAGVLAVVAMRMQGSVLSPLGEAVMHGRDVLVTLEIAGPPRTLEAANGPARVMFDAVITQSTATGRTTTGRLEIRVLAGMEWASVREGQVVGAAGKVETGPGTGAETDSRQAFLRPSTLPMPAPSRPGSPPADAQPSKESMGPGVNLHPDQGTQRQDNKAPLVTSLREAWKSTVRATWYTHSPDTAALLPGMVMGDRGAMDESLNESMKVVGLTHLTAVSGANCTLVLASLMLLLRTMHTPRTLAFAVSVAGLAGFVALVGPDPSVLRAAVMGGIGAMALLSGRPKRVGALLCGSIVVLLLADPWLAADYAFILSVLATLGLHLVGQRCVRWLSVLFPLWLAQAIAIPLAAQLFCAPVIVLLQARLTPYTIVANMAVAPVVALVTTAGTLGLVCAVPLPAAAVACAALSGGGAWWVAVVARWMSGLPASSLPWPEGGVGVVLMVILNASMLVGLVAVVDRQRTMAVVRLLLGFVPTWWRRRFGFASLVALAAAVAFFFCAAVVNG